MKTVLAMFLFAAGAFAQNPAACGPMNPGFGRKAGSAQHPLSNPAPGQALVYFIQDTGVRVTFGVYPTTAIGIDGAWVGAYKNDSWFSAPVDPGVHHVCAALHSLSTGSQMELAHFAAEAGQIYYFRTRLYLAQGLIYFQLEPVDSDEGKYLVARYPLSEIEPKK